MSRHNIPAKNPKAHEIVLGWDRPLRHFFLSVFDKTTDEDEDEYCVDGFPNKEGLIGHKDRRIVAEQDASAVIDQMFKVGEKYWEISSDQLELLKLILIGEFKDELNTNQVVNWNRP